MHGTGGRMGNRGTVLGHDTTCPKGPLEKKGCKRKENHTSGESGCLTHFTEHFGLDHRHFSYLRPLL